MAHLIGRKLWLAVAGGVILALVLAACGGGDPTATPKLPPTPTSPPPPTRPAPTPTATPAAVPTSVVKPAGKRGGTLNLRSIAGFPLTGDTYDARSGYDFGNIGAVLNNLIWKDPYGASGAAIAGDLADSWAVSESGTAITFKLRAGVKYHNGTPFTAKDVVYNLDRVINPRSPQMTFFKVTLAAMSKVEAVDDLTVKVTLKAPSNIFIPALALMGVLMYPSEYLFPERLDEWKKAGFVGTGPFKVTKYEPGVKMEYVRNPEYFKTGLPYVDGLLMVNSTIPVATAAFRAGKIDASSIDQSAYQYQRAELARELGFVSVSAVAGIYSIQLNQKFPFTEPKVREAIDLAMDRYGFANVWLQGDGDPLAPPQVPPERGGLWGISQSVLKTLPEYQEDKTAAVARGRALLKEAGIDPSAITINIMNNDTFASWGELTEAGIRALGFKTKLDIVSSAASTERLARGDFDINNSSYAIQLDDPGDLLARGVRSDGPFNYGKWKNPKLDQLFDEQDRTLDFDKRKVLVVEIQRIVMDDNVYIPAVIRGVYHGYFPWVKNYPTNLPFANDNLFRWEQVWLDRG